MRRTDEAEKIFVQADHRDRERAGGGHGDRRGLPAGLPPDFLDPPLGRPLHRRFFEEDWDLTFVPCHYGEAPILLNSQPQICGISADGGHLNGFQDRVPPRGVTAAVWSPRSPAGPG